MKVSFTAKEYARLLELVYLGLWVVGAKPDDPATTPERYEELAQKIFGLAQPLGCAELVEEDVNGQFYPAEKLSGGSVREKLDRFIDETFWNELVAQLAERDLRAELGPKFTPEETAAYSDKWDALEDNYWREFEKTGVEHLVLLRGARG